MDHSSLKKNFSCIKLHGEGVEIMDYTSYFKILNDWKTEHIYPILDEL